MGDRPPKAKRTFQYIAAIGATMGGWALGTVIGWMSPAQSELAKHDLGDTELSWIGSIMPLGAAVALFVLLFIFDLIGRKWIMIATVVPFIIGWCLLSFFTSFPILLVGRFITGFSGGVFCVIAPAFTAEIAEKEIRGMLGVCFQLFVNLGILEVYCLGETGDLVLMTLPNAAFPVICAIMMFFMKDSPIFFLKKGKQENAVASMQFYRGKDFNVNPEIAQMMEYTKTGDEKFMDVLKLKPTKKAVMMLLVLHIVQQLCGINAVLFYAHKIFVMSGSTIQPGLCAIILGIVMVVSTLIAAYLVDRLGRRILWLISLGVMAICLIILGVYFFIKDSDEELAESIAFLPLIAVCIYLVGFFLGGGPLPWTMLGELLPNRVKGVLGPLIGSMNWFLAFIVTLTFQDFLNLVGAAIVFWVFAVFCILGFVFVVFCLIETKNKTLDEIQKDLGG